MKAEIVNQALEEINNDGTGVQINLNQLEAIVNRHLEIYKGKKINPYLLDEVGQYETLKRKNSSENK